MKSRRFRILAVALASVVLLSAAAQAQWGAVVHVVRRMRTPDMDVATVMLEAKADAVYQAVLKNLTANDKVKITHRNDKDRVVEFTAGSRDAAIQVDQVTEGLAQITVGSPTPRTLQKSTTDLAVDQILAVCKQMGVTCTVGSP